MSAIRIVLISSLHYELKHNSRDPIFWKDLLHFCYNGDIAPIVIIVVFMMKVVFVGFIIVMNSRSFNWFDELSELEMQKRYADYKNLSYNF